MQYLHTQCCTFKIGCLSLKLAEKRGSLSLQSQVSTIVYQNILWISTPLQSIADGNFKGYKAGQQSGGMNSANYNYLFYSVTCYLMGQPLSDIRKQFRDYALKALHQGVGYAFQFCLLHAQVCILSEGLHLQNARQIDDIPGFEEILAIT